MYWFLFRTMKDGLVIVSLRYSIKLAFQFHSGSHTSFSSMLALMTLVKTDLLNQLQLQAFV